MGTKSRACGVPFSVTKSAFGQFELFRHLKNLHASDGPASVKVLTLGYNSPQRRKVFVVIVGPIQNLGKDFAERVSIRRRCTSENWVFNPYEATLTKSVQS